MKILVISELYPPYYVGGYEINCRDTVNALIDRGHEVTLLTSSWGLSRGSMQEDVYRVLEFDPIYLGNGINRNPKDTIAFFKKLIQFKRRLILRKNYKIAQDIILQKRPDIVYLWRLQNVTIAPAICAQNMGIPIIFRVEDYWLARMKEMAEQDASPLRRVYRSLVFEDNIFRQLRARNILMISQALKDYYVSVGFSEYDMKVIPSGLPSDLLHDPSDRSSRSFAADDARTIRLVYAGRIAHAKGPDIAIKALAVLNQPLVHLDIIGTGDLNYLEYLKQLAEQLGVEDKVHFLGKLDQDEILRRFSCYDALLFTSRWQEPFGRIVIEAMSQGVPVISVRSGGVSEIITDSENGMIVPMDDPISMADSIRKLIQDRAFAATLRRNAFTTVKTKFNLEQLTTCFEEYICDILKP